MPYLEALSKSWEVAGLWGALEEQGKGVSPPQTTTHAGRDTGLWG